ncbi:MAG: XRE family transcriptional regulator [Gammaproteobacteria bacterium]|nr:MAG: XRE family transcriptional regulator [Gammaproteobacteria bacterium]
MKLEYDNIFDAIIDDKSTASEYQTRSDLMIVIRDLINLKGWEQKVAGQHLGLSQPRVSDLVNGRIEKFSIDKLMNCLFKIGYRFKPTLVNEKLTMSVQRVSVG